MCRQLSKFGPSELLEEHLEGELPLTELGRALLLVDSACAARWGPETACMHNVSFVTVEQQPPRAPSPTPTLLCSLSLSPGSPHMLFTPS